MLECRDESEMYNYCQIQLSNDHFINRILGSTAVKILLLPSHYFTLFDQSLQLLFDQNLYFLA